MRYVADLHVHSPYAYATSRYLSLAALHQWAQVKGIDVVGTGDFTHPAWLAQLQAALVAEGNGFFKLKRLPKQGLLPGLQPKTAPVRFCLSSEVSCVYRYAGRVRKSHQLLYAPDFATVERLNARLARWGSLTADGRPTLRLSARDLLEVVLQVGQAYLIPAHVWTPWFSVLGSKAGYDSIQACFRDLTPHIFALETGLSSDPAMNWQLSALDGYTLVSNSDAHSAPNLGREVSCFATELSYEALFKALHTRKGFAGTLEFFPQEGKYYLDGHRSCQLCLYPKQTRAYAGRCPRCQGQLTVGVRHRVEALADRQLPVQPAGAPGFGYIVPLPELIAQLIGKGPKTKAVQRAFVQLINHYGSELACLRQVPLAQIEADFGAGYALAIGRLRQGQVETTPGYDGVYGTVHLTPQQPSI